MFPAADKAAVTAASSVYNRPLDAVKLPAPAGELDEAA
jgi:hypothetical protein